MKISDGSYSCLFLTINVVLHLAALCLFVTLSVSNVVDYIDQPKIQTLWFETASSIEFPNMTLCPTSWIDIDVLAESSLLDEDMIEYLTGGFLDMSLVPTFVPYRLNEDDLERRYNDTIVPHMNATDQNLNTLIASMAHSCENQVQGCRYHGGKPIPSTECCREHIRDTLLTTNMGVCMWFLSQNLQQTMLGPPGGLNLNLLVNPANPDVLKNAIEWTGYALYIDDGPAVNRPDPIIVAPSSYTLVRVKPTQESKTSNCVDDENYPTIRRFASLRVSRELCIYDCMVQTIFETCGCLLYTEDHGYIDWKTQCTPKQTATCVRPITDNSTELYTDCRARDTCPQQCERMVYETSVVVSERNYALETGVKERVNMEVSSGVEEILLGIYMSDLGFWVSEESESLTFSGLVADLGGQMGMWLGLSLLSVSEGARYLYKRFVKSRNLV